MNKNFEFYVSKYNKDYQSNSFLISKIINILKKHTIKNKIENKLNKIFSLIKIQLKVPLNVVIYNNIRHQKLLFKILKVKIAGRIYQLPTNFGFYNRYATSLIWLLKIITDNAPVNLINRFTKIFIYDSFTKNNTTDKTRNEIYKTITSYRGYLHFRWRN